MQEAFFSSTVAGQWVAFGMVWLLLLRLSRLPSAFQKLSSLIKLLSKSNMRSDTAQVCSSISWRSSPLSLTLPVLSATALLLLPQVI